MNKKQFREYPSTLNRLWVFKILFLKIYKIYKIRVFLNNSVFLYFPLLACKITEIHKKRIFIDFTNVFEDFLEIGSAISQLCQFAYFTRSLLYRFCVLNKNILSKMSLISDVIYSIFLIISHPSFKKHPKTSIWWVHITFHFLIFFL